MTIPCELTTKNGLPDWCEKHGKYHGGHHRKWALGTDEASDAKRASWDRFKEYGPPDSKTVPYTAAQMIAEYAATLARHVAGGSRMVPETVYGERRAKCNGCQYRNIEKDACRICGCDLSPEGWQATILGDKLRWAVASCPLPTKEWDEWKPEPGSS